MTLPFAVRKLGHVVINVADLEKSRRFYTEVLGFRPTDIYGDDKMPGGMVFLRCNGDHHCLALIGGAPPAGEARRTLHHMAFELATLDEVFRARDHLRRHGAKIVYEGRRRAGCQVSVEFLDPDGHHLELFWGLDQIGTDGRVRPADEWRQTATLEDAVRFAPPGQDTTLHDASLKRAAAAE
ncbi:MAG: VOC family protein [Reyranella sp.]|uniref:VOC family protein n=1 Tax=Reyranella sp. TaxID=1929291 RepID=UPI003D0DB848